MTMFNTVLEFLNNLGAINGFLLLAFLKLIYSHVFAIFDKYFVTFLERFIIGHVIKWADKVIAKVFKKSKKNSEPVQDKETELAKKELELENKEKELKEKELSLLLLEAQLQNEKLQAENNMLKAENEALRSEKVVFLNRPAN